MHALGSSNTFNMSHSAFEHPPFEENKKVATTSPAPQGTVNIEFQLTDALCRNGRWFKEMAHRVTPRFLNVFFLVLFYITMFFWCPSSCTISQTNTMETNHRIQRLNPELNTNKILKHPIKKKQKTHCITRLKK